MSLVLKCVQKKEKEIIIKKKKRRGEGKGGRSCQLWSAVLPGGHLSTALCWSERRFGLLTLPSDPGDSTFQRVWVSRWILLDLEEPIFKLKKLSTFSLQNGVDMEVFVFQKLASSLLLSPTCSTVFKTPLNTAHLVIVAAVCHTKCFLCILPHICFGLRYSPVLQMFTAGRAPADICRRAASPTVDRSDPGSSCCPFGVWTFSNQLWSCPEHRVYFY